MGGLFEQGAVTGLAFSHPLLGCTVLGNFDANTAYAVDFTSQVEDGEFDEVMDTPIVEGFLYHDHPIGLDDIALDPVIQLGAFLYEDIGCRLVEDLAFGDPHLSHELPVY